MFYYQGRGGGFPFMEYRSIGDILKEVYRSGSALTRIVFINVGIYLLTKVGLVLSFLLAIPKKSYFETLHRVLDLPGSGEDLSAAPWTMLTYMFTHYSLFHLFLNMVFLVWFGKKLKEDISSLSFWGIYLAGGIFGGCLYVYAAPMLDMDTSFLNGASASVMAVMAARCVSAWRQTVNLILLGNVKNLYILLFITFLGIIYVSAPEGGVSSLVHLGGILAGVLAGVAVLLKTGTSRTAKDTVGGMEFSGGFQETGVGRKRARKRESEDRLNEILDKVSDSGYESLTPEEKNILFKSGQNNGF